MSCFVFILAYPGFFYAVHSGIYLIGSWALSEKTMNATLDRCDFVIPLVSLIGSLIIVSNVCDSAIRILTSAFAWPLWFSLPTYLSLGVTISISVGVGMAFYYTEIIAAQTWMKLRTRNKLITKRWVFGETKRIVRQGQRLPIGLLLGCIFGEVILEELLWRGYLISYANDVLSMSVQYTVVISSLAFGMNHLVYGLANVISKTLFGIILSIMYLVSESLFPCILCHLVFNIMVFKIRIEWKL